MTNLNQSKIKDYYLTEVLYNLHTVESKISLFENKYQAKFEDFSKRINTKNQENFEEWDDYIEWKAYIKSRDELLKQKQDIESGNINIS